MPVGLQEVVALAIVIAIVGFALYRRWRRSADTRSSCCDQPAAKKSEKTVHFYKRADD
ncbi:MAG: hypothetical protein QNJ73_10890 [Gammaproteobacteria bacterium]|nr:hypothetical protein [Gammaproteobacteria bacterium]